MKASAQTTRPGKTLSTRPAKARVQLIPRVGAMNGHSTPQFSRTVNNSSRLEQEAHAAAEAFLRGEYGLARRLSRTSPASFRINHTRGVALPEALSNDLERAFGADLSQVRLHRDTPAFRAANDFGALAFAAGRDIYFSEHAPSLSSQPGQRLLAHEVAHTIQQTGRAAANNGIAVAHTTGPGAPQLAYSTELESTPDTERPSFSDLVDRYLKTEKDPKAVDAIKGLRKKRLEAIAKGDEEAFWTDLEKKVKDDKAYDAESWEVRSFVYEWLKIKKKYAAAAYLLSKDNSLAAMFFAKEVYEQMPDIGYDWLIKFWLGEGGFFHNKDKTNPRNFTPKRFVESIYNFLIGATRDVPDLNVNTPPFKTLVEDELNKIKEPAGFIGNELYQVTLWAIKETDQVRTRKLAQLAQKLAPEVQVLHPGGFAQWLSPAKRKAVAKAIAAWAETLSGAAPELDKASKEVGYIFSQLGKAIQTAAQDAVAFWEGVEGFGNAIATGAVVQGIRPSSVIKKFADRDEFQQFRSALAKVARKQLELITPAKDTEDKDEQAIFPSPVNYEKDRDAFVKTVRLELWKRFESSLFVEINKPEPPSGKKPTSRQRNYLLILSYGWMARQVYDLLEVLSHYRREDDEKFAADPITTGRADVRITHRNELATWLWFFGNTMGWEEFMVLGNAVISSQQKIQTKSQLALLGNWKEDFAPITKLTDDFGASKTVGQWEPMTFGDLANFYQTQRMKDITGEIIGLMSQPNAFDPKQDALVSRAIRSSDKRAAQGKLYPRRFSLESYTVQLRPEDARAGNFSDLVRYHPKTQVLISAEKPQDGDAIIPTRPAQGIFLWFIPSFVPLFKVMQKLDELHVLIFKYRNPKAEPQEGDLQPIRSMEPIPWFLELNKAVNTLDAKTVREAHKKLAERIIADFKTARTALNEKFREASIKERTMRVQQVLQPALDEYDRWGQFAKSTTLGGIIFELPGKVIMQIGAVASAMAPFEEQNFHYAAMFLELAEVMNKKLSVAPRVDVANDYFPAINVALDIITKSRASILELMPGRTSSWIDERVKLLNELQTELKKALVTGQMAFGLIGHNESGNQFVTGVSEGDIIPAEEKGKREPFTIDGITWAIVKVHKNFRFHPKYGALESVLFVEDEEIPAEKRTSSLVLVTVSIEGKDFPITAAKKDEELLAKLSYAVTMRLIIKQLEELADMMEQFAELALDAFELVPGAGQAVMAARLAIAIMTFIASGEAKAYVDALTDDPIGEVKRVLDLIESLFTPDELWHMVLLGNNKFDQLHSKPRPKDSKTPKNALQKFLRLVGRIWNLGEGILGSVGRMQSHVRWEVEALQMIVLRHPLLAGALRWISNNIEQIVHISLIAIAVGEKLLDKSGKNADKPEETELDLKEQFGKAVDALPERINAAAFQLGEIRLPNEVLPLGEIVDVIVETILNRLGGKYKLAGKVILKLLDIAGKREAVFKAIGSLIPEEIDPNTYWRSKVVKPLGPMLNEAKDALIDGFYDQLLKFNIFEQKKNVLEAGRRAAHGKQIGYQEGELPESQVQPFGIIGRRGGGKRIGPMPRPGPPLNPFIRRRAEHRFGHDFSHVRLSTGFAAANFTGRFGSDALTCGSHVYLRPGLSPTAGRGARILDHEFTHVLQQTGPRPLGRTHSRQPVLGEPGRGLVINPVSERAADRVASAVSSRRANSAISTGQSRKGWQPALPYNVIRGLLDDITSTSDIEQDEAKVDMTGETTGLKKLPSAQKKRIENFAKNLKQAIQDAKDFEAPFNDTGIPDAIKRQILTAGPSGGTHFSAIENALADLAADSLRERKAKDGEIHSSLPQIVAHIVADRFGVAVARYIFGRTGILMELDVLPADKSDEETAVTVSKVRVVYVHLPPIHAKHELWTKAVAGLTGKNKEETDLLADTDRFARRLRLYLESKGPTSGIWKPKSYGLQQRVLSDLVEFVKATAAGDADLTPAELPSKKEYLDPTGAPGPNGHIGLRIGTYKDSNNQQGRDRESHHTTQFLLLEYFAHKNDTQKSDDSKPFPLISKHSDIYPGLEASGGAPSKFSGPGKPLDLAGFVKGRGDPMPAILLARPHHRNGGLHVTAKADDFVDKADSPAGVVSFVFHEKLGGDDSEYRKAEKAGATAFKSFVSGKGDDAVKGQIYSAMQGTYKWMRDYMRERLDNGLPGLEMKYFNQLAEDGGRKDRLKVGEMKIVAAAAKENNNIEMAKWGWVG